MKKRFFAFIFMLISIFVGVLGISACSKVSCKINFIVDDSVYATIDTNGEEVVKMPDNPIKDGYVFDGWYWDEDTWQAPFTANSLLNAPLSSDMNVYCKWKENDVVIEDKITFNTLSVEGEMVYGKVSHNTTTFSFINEIIEHGNATYQLYKEITCETLIASKSIPLIEGDNTVYVLQSIDKNLKLYTVTLHRRLMFEVVFNTDGGTETAKQIVEEDSFATMPTTTKIGYTFVKWDYDFTTPITQNMEIKAIWKANTDTKYVVNHYLENLEDDEYTLSETETLTGETDTIANAKIKDYQHFTYEKEKSTVIGNIGGDESCVLNVYYSRNEYTVSIDKSYRGEIIGQGTYKYGTSLEVVASPSTLLAYIFAGWYNDDILLSAEYRYTFMIEKDVMAKYVVREEMRMFEFSCSATTCTITGVVDKDITEAFIPDCVTAIDSRAFYQCRKLKKVTMRNNVTSIGDSAFEGCESLVSVQIGSFVEKIYSYAFSYCYNLLEIEIPRNVSFMGTKVFLCCDALTIYCVAKSKPDGWKETWSEYDNSTLSRPVVWDCENNDKDIYGYRYTVVNGVRYSISNSNTVSVEHQACVIETAIIESSIIYKDVSYSVTSIRGGAFSNCWKVTKIIIPDSVTSIGRSAFKACTSLTEIIIPDSVKSVGEDAFKDCDNLMIYCEHEVEPSGWNSAWNPDKCLVEWGYKG